MENNKVLATVAGRNITEQDLNTLLSSLNPQQAMQFNSEEGKKQLVQELVNQELFFLDAVKNGLDKQEAFISELQKMQDNMLKQYAMHTLLINAKVNEEDIKAYYEKNIEMFRQPEEVQASHILIDSEEKAQEIVEEINGGLSFEDAAAKYSSCPSNANGGDLGYFSKGRMVPEFEAAAFEMNVGEISAPVKSQFGYHIIKLVDKKEAAIQPLETVSDQLSHQLLSMKQQELYLDKVEALKSEYEITINE